jgi:hypothetical protein
MTVAVVTINQRHLLLFLLILAHLKEQSYQTFIHIPLLAWLDRPRSGEQPLLVLKIFRGSSDFTLTINTVARLMPKKFQ